MIIKLLAKQIPIFWDTIKFTVKQADEVDDKDFQPYANGLLHDLLNDKAQCFVRLDDKRILIALLITRINTDKISGHKSLFLQSLYSWAIADRAIWERDYDFISQFAEKEGCKRISLNTRNSKIIELVSSLGLKEKYRVFETTVRGV